MSAKYEFVPGTVVHSSWTQRLNVPIPPQSIRDRLQLPVRYALATLAPEVKDTYPAALYDTAYNYLRQWPTFAQRGMGPVFVGPTGSGTSWVSAALLNEISMRSEGKQEVNCLWLSTFWKLRLMLESRDESYEYYAAQRAQAFRHQLVVVDDLLGAKTVEGGVAWLHSLYTARYDAGLPTITTITTDNLDQIWRQVQNVFGRTFTERLQATSTELVGVTSLS